MENEKFRWISNRTDAKARSSDNTRDIWYKYYRVINLATGLSFKISNYSEDPNHFHHSFVIPDELLSDEFIGWAISTSETFVEDVDRNLLTQRVMDYVVTHFEHVEVFRPSNTSLCRNMTEYLWSKAFERNKNVVRYIPREFLDNNLLNAFGEIHNPTMTFIKYSDLTPELFSKMYYNSDDKHKLQLIPPYNSRQAFEANIKDHESLVGLITEDIARDILSIDIKTIWNIPKKFLTEEDCNKALGTDIFLLPVIPPEYQTEYWQKKLIDRRIDYTTLIDPDALTDKMIYYILGKSGLALSYIPEKRRTKEICEYAIAKIPSALQYIPVPLKTEDMCFDAVVRDFRVIKFVPVKFVTKDFVERLKNKGIAFTGKGESYIQRCLEVHAKINGEVVPGENINPEPLKVDEKYADIPLNSLKGLLSELSYKVLLDINILTVGDIIDASNNSDFYEIILGSSKSAYKEICAAIKLLKYKYMGISPMIDILDSDNTREVMKKFCEDVGFSSRAENVLLRKKFTIEELFEIIRSPERYNTLLRCHNAGKSTVQEIVFKTSILVDYFDKNKKEEPKENTDEKDAEIKALQDELSQLREEIGRLNTRTDEIIAKIQEKSLGQSKVRGKK